MRSGSAKRLRLVGRQLLASGLAMLLMLLSLLSASDLLHRYFHHVDQVGSSACAVCLLVKGQLESPGSVPIVLGALRLETGVTPSHVAAAPTFFFSSTLSRAPPRTIVLVSVAV
jgi:hypothetical protein